MTDAEISLVLQMISEWVELLEDDKLSEQCRISGNSFFVYMKSRGIHPGELSAKIEKVTGYHPRKLFRVSDASLLRDAILRYEGSVEASKRGEDPRFSVDHFWGN